MTIFTKINELQKHFKEVANAGETFGYVFNRTYRYGLKAAKKVNLNVPASKTNQYPYVSMKRDYDQFIGDEDKWDKNGDMTTAYRDAKWRTTYYFDGLRLHTTLLIAEDGESIEEVFFDKDRYYNADEFYKDKRFNEYLLSILCPSIKNNYEKFINIKPFRVTYNELNQHVDIRFAKTPEEANDLIRKSNDRNIQLSILNTLHLTEEQVLLEKEEEIKREASESES